MMTQKRINKNYFDIPECAWKRSIGDIPKDCASNSPKRGVALGGFGTGSFMYNIAGTFGPWQTFDNAYYKEIWLDSAAFHVYEKIGERKPVTRCLAVDKGLKKAWKTINKGDGDYYALQPFGWTTYNCFNLNISQKFFSPIIPHNYKETTYPTAIWEFKVHNPTSEKAECSIMLTFPGLVVNKKGCKNSFRSMIHINKDYSGLVLKAKDGSGEWCLAGGGHDKLQIVSFAEWNEKEDGSDIWEQFKKTGILIDKKKNIASPAGAIAVKISLEPGEKKSFPIVLSWDFPVVRFGKKSEWWKKYCDYFNKKANNSFKIAKESLLHYKEWEDQILKWMDPVIKNKKYPDWLKCSAFNELYYSQFGGIFYSSELKSGKEMKKFNSFEHIFFEMECMMYPFCNTLDVRHYSSLPYARFWPKIERELLLLFAQAILKNKGFQTPHDSGNPKDDPFFNFDDYGTSKLNWKDLSSKFIQQCWRYFYLYEDKEFLKQVWQACVKTYEYMKSTDKNLDCLPDNYGSDNTYDSWGLFGTSLLCGGLWITALECLTRMAKIMKDPLDKEIKTWIKKARINLEKQLWLQDKGYYRIDTESKESMAIMSDGLNGQRYAELYGLPDILKRSRIKSHLKNVYKKCVVPLADYNGDGIGDVGAINGMNHDDQFLGVDQSDEIWTGSTYFLSASMYHAGLKAEALNTAFGVYHTTYKNDQTAYWFNTPEAWDRFGKNPRPWKPEQYQRPRAVWELLLEIDDPYK